MVNENYIDQLIENTGLRPGDSVWIGERFLDLKEHYIIYLGREESGYPLFVGSFASGIRYLSMQQLIFLVRHTAEARKNPFIKEEKLRFRGVERMMTRMYTITFRLILQYSKDFTTEVIQSQKGTGWKKVALGIGLGALGATMLGLALKNWNDSKD